MHLTQWFIIKTRAKNCLALNLHHYVLSKLGNQVIFIKIRWSGNLHKNLVTNVFYNLHFTGEETWLGSDKLVAGLGSNLDILTTEDILLHHWPKKFEKHWFKQLNTFSYKKWYKAFNMLTCIGESLRNGYGNQDFL